MDFLLTDLKGFSQKGYKISNAILIFLLLNKWIFCSQILKGFSQILTDLK